MLDLAPVPYRRSDSDPYRPLVGNADTATALQTARTITIGGDAAGRSI